MDNCATPELLPVEQALALMQAQLSPLTETQVVPLAQALDRVLAAAICAQAPLPAWDNSAMDGYALRAQEASLSIPLQVVGQALAGHPFTGDIPPQGCIRITTGAPVPSTLDTVIMQEHTARNGDQLYLQRLPQRGDNIRCAGEDVATGTEVFSQGHRLTPVDIGMLASLGIAEVAVIRPLKVALIATGDELTPAGAPLAPGGIYDSNRPMLRALLIRLGAEVIDMGTIADEPMAIGDAFRQAAEAADAVISSGGVSVGDADYTQQVLAEIGQIRFWKIAMKPGKPFAFGWLTHHQKRCWFFGLPGNPVSAAVTYHQLALPMLRQLSGEPIDAPVKLTAIAAHDFKKQPGRADYQRILLQENNGVLYAQSTGNQSSGALSSLCKAHGYAVLEQGRGRVAAGETVQVLLLDKFIR